MSPSPARRRASLPWMLWRQTAAQVRIAWRSAALSTISLLMPVMLFTLFGLKNAHRPLAPGVTVGAYELASLGAYAVSSTMVYNFGLMIAHERSERADLLPRALPLPATVYLAAKALTAIAYGLLSLLVLFAFARFAAGVTLSPRTWLALAWELLFGALPFVGMGLALAYLTAPSSANAVANMTYLVLAFASGLIVPLRELPGFIVSAAPYLPTYHYAQLAWHAIGWGDERLWKSAVWLFGYLVLFFSAAVYAYGREQSRKFG